MTINTYNTGKIRQSLSAWVIVQNFEKFNIFQNLQYAFENVLFHDKMVKYP